MSSKSRRVGAIVLALAAVGSVAAGLAVWLIRDDVAIAVDSSVPAANPLQVPPKLEGSPNADGTFGFDLSIDESQHTFVDDLQADTLAYNGQSVLGPTIEIEKDSTVEIDVTNNLDERTTTHWHGADVPAVADGGPHSIIEPGETWQARFDVIQPAATMWYHPHLMGRTAEDVYSGAAGVLIVKDDNPLAVNLPKNYGVDDIPVVLQDRNFSPDGEMEFDLNTSGRGRLMETLTVNATIDPFIEVPQGLIRLRLLNGSQARIYSLSVDGSAMTKIASDGGYLTAPAELDRLELSPGDRAEILVEVGAEPVMLLDSAFERVLELRPTSAVSVGTEIPDQLATFDRIDEAEIDVDRSFNLSEVGGDEWGINGQTMDMARVDETIRFGDTERWTITVDNGQHAFHVHQTQFQILSINGKPPPVEDAGWEDTVWVNGSREVEIAMRFDSYTNPDIPYMFHCHILDHEDVGMMGQFRVVDG